MDGELTIKDARHFNECLAFATEQGPESLKSLLDCLSRLLRFTYEGDMREGGDAVTLWSEHRYPRDPPGFDFAWTWRDGNEKVVMHGGLIQHAPCGDKPCVHWQIHT